MVSCLKSHGCDEVEKMATEQNQKRNAKATNKSPHGQSEKPSTQRMRRGEPPSRDVGGVPRDRWDEITVREAMRPLQELHVILPETPVLDALKLVTSKDVNQLPVVANGTLQGVVSRSQLLQLLQVRSELQLSAAYHPQLDRENKTEKPSSAPVE